MPIPPLDEHGLLPPGVHPCTVDEMAEMFAGSTSGHRRDIFNGFLQWRSLLMRRNLGFEVYADGSFTTSKERPKDVDVALRSLLPGPTPELLRELAAIDHLVNPDLAKPRYYVDPHVYYDHPDGDDDGDMVKLFCSMRPEDARRHGVPARHVRGILRVLP